MNSFTFKQKLPIPLEEAWLFFSNPVNLGTITPPYMNFRIMNEQPDIIYEGMFIIYKVSPVFNLSLKWTTEITHIQSQEYFVDEQRSGPYRIWHHEHHFKRIEQGVEMTDILHYQLYGGFLGGIINKILVQKKVLEIFEFRRKKLNSLFGAL